MIRAVLQNKLTSADQKLPSRALQNSHQNFHWFNFSQTWGGAQSSMTDHELIGKICTQFIGFELTCCSSCLESLVSLLCMQSVVWIYSRDRTTPAQPLPRRGPWIGSLSHNVTLWTTVQARGFLTRKTRSTRTPERNTTKDSLLAWSLPSQHQ